MSSIPCSCLVFLKNPFRDVRLTYHVDTRTSREPNDRLIGQSNRPTGRDVLRWGILHRVVYVQYTCIYTHRPTRGGLLTAVDIYIYICSLFFRFQIYYIRKANSRVFGFEFQEFQVNKFVVSSTVVAFYHLVFFFFSFILNSKTKRKN